MKSEIISLETAKKIEELERKNKKLNNIINKAIEYINTLYISVYDPDGYFITINGNDNLEIEDITKNIKNILQGVDKE